MVQLPSGTVTFFFTDIEGLTRLLQNLRERGEAQIAEERSDEGRGSAIWARGPAATELGLGQCSGMSPVHER